MVKVLLTAGADANVVCCPSWCGYQAKGLLENGAAVDVLDEYEEIPCYMTLTVETGCG